MSNEQFNAREIAKIILRSEAPPPPPSVMTVEDIAGVAREVGIDLPRTAQEYLQLCNDAAKAAGE